MATAPKAIKTPLGYRTKGKNMSVGYYTGSKNMAVVKNGNLHMYAGRLKMTSNRKKSAGGKGG